MLHPSQEARVHWMIYYDLENTYGLQSRFLYIVYINMRVYLYPYISKSTNGELLEGFVIFCFVFILHARLFCLSTRISNIGIRKNITIWSFDIRTMAHYGVWEFFLYIIRCNKQRSIYTYWSLISNFSCFTVTKWERDI